MVDVLRPIALALAFIVGSFLVAHGMKAYATGDRANFFTMVGLALPFFALEFVIGEIGSKPINRTLLYLIGCAAFICLCSGMAQRRRDG